MTAISGLIIALLSIPPVRVFLEDVFVRVFMELMTRQDSDPEFAQQFTSLTRELGGATTEEEKREILKKISALRKSPAP